MISKKPSFAKFGSILILSKTNSFRTLVAEAFIRSAIRRRFDERMKLANSNNNSNQQVEDLESGNTNNDNNNNESLEIDADLMFSNPQAFEEKLKAFKLEIEKEEEEKKSNNKKKYYSSSSKNLPLAHPNLIQVTSAGRNHIPARETAQLHPIAEKILRDRFSGRVFNDILGNGNNNNNDDEAAASSSLLWRKGISSILNQVNTFDVIVSIVDGERIVGDEDLSSNNFNNMNGAVSNTKSHKEYLLERLKQNIDAKNKQGQDTDEYEGDDDDDDQGQGEKSATATSRFFSSKSSSTAASRSRSFCEPLDSDPFANIPGMDAIMQNNKKSSGALEGNFAPSHWIDSSSGDGSFLKNRSKIYSPRKVQNASDESTKRFQDDYAGEPQFNEVVRLRVAPTVKIVRWYLPSTADLTKKQTFESEAEYEDRVFEVIKKIDKLVEDLCCA